MAIAESGMPVYWADGHKTTFNLLGDLQTARFPNTDEGFIDPATGQSVAGFFDWFGLNWATPPADGRPGVRQSLIVDAETISNNVGRLLELMRDGVDMNGQPVPGPNNEWGVPAGPITPLMAHAAAAVRFPNGWQASPERRKYMAGSVATDPKPKPPAPDPRDATIADLRTQLASAQGKLADAVKAKEDALKAELLIRGRVAALLSDLEARAKGMKTAAGPKGGGKYAQALRQAATGLEQSVAAYREKAGA